VQVRVKSAGMMLGGIRWRRVELAVDAIPTLWGDRGGSCPGVFLLCTKCAKIHIGASGKRHTMRTH
jgi:hypothetical protein